MKKYIPLIILLLLASPLYLIKLDSIPPGFYLDEATIGYNAYSILQTAKDEYGQTLPIAFRLFGSYSPPLFIYLLVPFIKLIGLTVFTIRLPSAIMAIITGLIVFLLAKKLKINPYLSAILFLISPWNIFFGRIGYEIYLGFFLFCLSSLLFYSSLKNQKLIIPAYLVLSLSAYSSHPQKILAPIFLFLFLVIFKKSLHRQHLTGLLLCVITQIPNLYLLGTPAFWVKTGLFSSSKTINSLIFDKLSQMSTYLSPRSLFFLPDPDPQRSIPELSVFYPWMVFPYITGLYLLWSKLKKPQTKYILILLFSSIIPASLANDPFSTQRNLQALLPLILIIGLGTQTLLKKLPHLTLLPILAFSLLTLWRSYFVLFPSERATFWNHGHRQLAQIIRQYPDTPIIIDNQKPSYITLAFFLQTPPSKFQKQNFIVSNYYHQTKFDQTRQIDNIEFRSIHWKTDIYKEQILIGSQLAISPDQATEHCLEPIFTIKNPQNKISFQGYKTNPTQKIAQKDKI